MPPFPELIRDGLGQLTRVFGSRPLEPGRGAAELARLQAQIIAASRFGIPAIAHEECLTGFATWSATAFPTPLAWGAVVRPRAGHARWPTAIGASMRAAGVHQGLAPVLDVARDPRWGRVEETIGADPYLVGVLGTAYVRGLQSTGVIATLKHFAGYSGSRAGRNMAPVSVGRREFADVFLPPFEMAIREGGARSVMHSYADVDGVPPAADRWLLTELLRDELGFDGVVVADYYGISFLETLHGVAGSPAQAAALALRAGVDVELPNVRCYGAPLADAVRSGDVPEYLVDRAAGRVLRHKFELGLLDPGRDVRAAARARATSTSTRPPTATLARRLAEESVVLLANEGGALPLRSGGQARRRRPAGRRSAGVLRLLHVPPARRPRAPGRQSWRTADAAAHRAAAGTARRPDRVRARLRRARRRPPRRSRPRWSARATADAGGRGARRRGRAVRPGQLGRGLRRDRPAAARGPGGAA